MASICYHVVTKTGEGGSVYIEHVINTSVENECIEEFKGEMALEVLKSMKLRGFLEYAYYETETVLEDKAATRIDIV